MIPEPVAGGEVVLRPWTPEEAGLYVELRDDVVFRFTTEPQDLDERQCRANIEAAIADPDVAPFAICEKDGAVIGNLSVSCRGDTAVIAYWLAARARGRGRAAAALEAATAWAFEKWSIAHAELEIDPGNTASLRVAQAAGYRRQGLRLESACGGPAIVLRRSGAEVLQSPG